MELYSEVNTLDSLTNVNGFDSVGNGKYVLQKSNGIFIPSQSDVSLDPNGGLESSTNGIAINVDNATTEINGSNKLIAKLQTTNGCINADASGIYVARNPEDNASGLERNGNGLRIKHGNGLVLNTADGLVLQTVDGDEIIVTANGIQSALRSFVMFDGYISNNLQSANITTSNNATVTSTSLGVFDINLQKGRYLCSYHFAKPLDYTITTASPNNVSTPVNETHILDCKEPNDKFVLTISTPQASIRGYFDIEISYLLPVTQI